MPPQGLRNFLLGWPSLLPIQCRPGMMPTTGNYEDSWWHTLGQPALKMRNFLMFLSAVGDDVKDWPGFFFSLWGHQPISRFHFQIHKEDGAGAVTWCCSRSAASMLWADESEVFHCRLTRNSTLVLYEIHYPAGKSFGNSQGWPHSVVGFVVAQFCGKMRDWHWHICLLTQARSSISHEE